MSVEQPRILLVDDNPQNLKVLYETLRDRGHHLLIANDGEKALQLAQRHHPQVILLDIMMPGMDGFAVCQALKADERTRSSAVIFLSALDDLDAKVRGFDLGGADYIAKPFQPQEVIARVETHVRITQLERSLEARNRQLEGDQVRILDAISEGIYGLNAQGRITFANPAAARMAGVTAQQLIGRDICELHFRDRGEGAPAPTLRELGICHHETPVHQRGIRMHRTDGSTFPAEYRASPRFEEGVLQGSVVVFRDISVELDQEQALDEARQTVEVQREQLAHASRLSTMGEMAAGFAHEVNQPLTAIANYVSLAERLLDRETLETARLQEVLPKIGAQAHRASEIIRRIRGFVQKPASGRERVDVGQLLEDSRAFAEVDARTNRIDIQLDVAAGLPEVLADPVQVQQVVLNLIRNALEASRMADSQTAVLVSARWDEWAEGMVQIEVRDQGCGLPADAEEKLFHPFFTTKSQGMGIGLPLCRSLVQAQGGEIGFERRAEGGTRFWFTLPAATQSRN